MMLRMAGHDMDDEDVYRLGSGACRAPDRRRDPGPQILAMSDPFIRPEEPTAAEAIAAIGDELGVFDDWMDRYQYIIELGRKLPPFPDAVGR